MLGTFNFPTGTIWQNELDYIPIRQATKRTTDGGMVFWQQNLMGGQQITIQFSEKTTWLTHDQVVEIRALASSGQSLAFTWDNFSTSVYFDYNKPFNFSRIYESEENSDDLFFGQLNLISRI
jgi:hypothetical protein